LSPVDEATLIASAGPDANADVDARRSRVVALLRRPAPLGGEDAELVALLALAHALPIKRREDRLSARQRLREIGNLEDPPPQVAKVVARLKTAPGDGTAFAEALLPPKSDVGHMSEHGPGFVHPPST